MANANKEPILASHADLSLKFIVYNRGNFINLIINNII